MQSFFGSSRGYAVLAFLVTATLPFLGFGKSLGTSDPILEIHTDSLTTYKYASASNGQDVQPQVGHRGMNLDGMLRSVPSQLMHIHGNPFEDAWKAPELNGMRLDLGSYATQDADIALPASVPWIIGRSYNAQQDDSGHRDSDGYQGKNWFQNSQPEIVFYNDATDTNDIIYLLYGADRYAEYNRIDGGSFTGKGTNGATGISAYTNGGAGAPDIITIHDQHGNKLYFFGFDTDAAPAKGQIWKIENPAGDVAYVGHETSSTSAISDGYTTDGYIEEAYDSAGRRFTYTYTELDSVDRLTKVEVEINSGGWTTVAEVDYEYYTDESNGDVGDLKLVEITTPMTDSGVEIVRKKYYRYWEGTFNDTTNPGHPHAIKYIVDFEGTRNQDWEDSTFDEDFLSLSDSSLEPYAAAYFEYDSNHRIDLAWFNGECGCSGVNGTYEFEYETNGSFSDDTGAYDNTPWKTRTIVEQPDGTYLTQYWDEAHQPLSRVFTDDDPDNTNPSPEQWVTEVTRNTNGAVTTIYTPANIDTYTHSTGSITNKGYAGLVWVYTRASSGVAKSFATAKRFKVGKNGESNYYVKEWAYDSAAVEIPASSGDHNIRPLLDTVHDYHVEGTSTSNRITTDHKPTVVSSSLTLEKIAVEDPVITTAMNGPGGSDGMEVITHYRTDGTIAFREDLHDEAGGDNGIITYYEYTNGQLTKLIEDVDTGETSDFDISVPSGLASDSEAVHRTTTFTYDDQGRRDIETRPDGRKIKYYYSKLSDGRQVTLRYNDYESTPKFYGPVSYTVSNHAGNTEVGATVALTSNESTTALTGHVDETDDDPITAMDLGTAVRMSTSHYNESGQVVEESRLYFTVPSSGEGSDGTNYDPTVYGYDSMGRQHRVKEPSGTIRRKVFDALGRLESRWIGTNDQDEAGTDDMVEFEGLEYDSGNDNGNSYLTKKTLYVEDSTTDKRETSYTNDVRGRALLEENPESPHIFNKLDNQGRRIAIGHFSSTASINVTSDDPTTETTNRLWLLEYDYDQKGRLAEFTRHEIDASDGSDDDSIDHDIWRDHMGRIVKDEGPELRKSEYDRSGRERHRYILAADNDSSYSDVDDVAGDHVLEQTTKIYDDDSGELHLEVRVERFHDDWGGGETTGALDTNADSDDLLVTASNLEGRAQITCYWYDRFNRQIDEVRYGTNSGSNLDRDGLSVPARSDTALRTSRSYDTTGNLEEVTDPRDLVIHYDYDDAGRRTKEIRNYDASVNSGDPSGTDDNQTVEYEYTDGLRTKITVDLPSGSTDQETTYTYGTTKGASAGDSKIATGHLLQEVKYPDSGGSTDVVSYAYNAQEQEIWREDQAGNVIETDYNDVGQVEHERVTTLDSDFDGAVLRISTTYDSMGLPELVTQYDNATVGSGSVVDEVKYTYDGWHLVTKFEQDRNGAVTAMGDQYEVSYTNVKATGGRNDVRRSDMTLPSGNVITFAYKTTDKGDSASRVSALKDGATFIADYDYLGVGHVVGTTLSEADVSSLQYSGGSYPDLDNFDRVVTSRWTADTASVDFYDVDLTYDRNSNITLAEDNVHSGFDVSYTVDDLNRLTDAQEGSWNGSTITSETRHQEWTLSHTGNWDLAKLDLDGDDAWTGTDEYEDDRTHNNVNELTGRDIDNDSTDDHNPSYDEVGNLIDDDENYQFEYDAFGRLRKIKDQETTPNLVAEFTYNGLGFLIGTHEDQDDDQDVDGSDSWFYTVYDEAWRPIARFRESDSAPKEELVPHMAGLGGFGGSSYINGIVLRDKDANTAWNSAADGTMEQRYYYCQNWHGEVSVLVDAAGGLEEWVKYSSYGVPIGMPAGDTDSDGDCDSTDITQIQTWIDASAYDVRGDVDLDGDVDSTDKTIAKDGTTLGWKALSTEGNETGYAGYKQDARSLAHVRNRVYSAELGRWLSRDPFRYADSYNLQEYVASKPIIMVDPKGTFAGVAAATTPPQFPAIAAPPLFWDPGPNPGANANLLESQDLPVIGSVWQATQLDWERGLEMDIFYNWYFYARALPAPGIPGVPPEVGSRYYDSGSQLIGSGSGDFDEQTAQSFEVQLPADYRWLGRNTIVQSENFIFNSPVNFYVLLANALILHIGF